MPVKSNIELGSGTLYFKGIEGVTDSIDISEDTEWADDKEYIKINNSKEATFEVDLSGPIEWQLVKCKDCGTQFPMTTHNCFIYGFSGWSCPLCAVIRQARGRANA